MKKILTALLLACLALSPLACLAEPADLSAYDDSALVALLQQVQDEIVARGIEKTAHLNAGTYVGGRDIPIGSYILTSAGAEEDYGIVSLRSVNDPEDDYPSKLYEFTQEPTDYSAFVAIEEGDTLVLPYPYDLTISAGITFK